MSIRKRSLVITAAVFLALMLFRSPGVLAAAEEKQANDKEYTAKILEYTTEKFFSTELVDHLPASAAVPTPLAVIGHIAGAPDVLDHSAVIYKYLRALAAACPGRIKLFPMGTSDEGREMILLAVSSEENMAALDRHRDILAKLADPRKLKAGEAEKLIAEGVPIYWITGSLHSTETGSPEMIMELAYRLAVEDTPHIRAIRNNMIVMMTPIQEVDGWDRSVDMYTYKKDSKDKKTLPDVYWGHYVLHDNNRDAIGLGLKLSENMLRTYFQWHPIVVHDLHESVPYLYTSTGTGPFNAWLDPIAVNEWEELAAVEVSEMTRRGVPGVWTHGFFDGWAAGYGYYLGLFHNSIGKFYETFGGTGADTLVRTVAGQTKRDWYRPNPPLEVVKWSFRDNINYQQSALLLAFKYVADNKTKFMTDFYLKSRRSTEKARTEGPAAYVIPADGSRPVAAARLVNLLRKNGVEIQTLKAETTVGQDKFPAGSYVVRMDQPYSRGADMLLDIQYYSPKDPQPYDDTGWTLGPLFNVRTVRVADVKVLDAPMTLLANDAAVAGGAAGREKAAAFVVNNRAEAELTALRYRLKDVHMLAAEEPFSQGGVSYKAGSFIIPAEGNGSGLVEALDKACREFGFTAQGLPAVPKIKTHDLPAPRIAILHSWIYTQDEGWYRLAFDHLGIPYSYISLQDVRDEADLRAKYDVIIFPPTQIFGNIQRIVNGLGGDAPIPWKAGDRYPNLGGPASSDDIRGGMELQGVMHLKDFVEKGGLFVPITSNADLPISYGLVESVAVMQAPKLRAVGSVLSANIIDITSPIGYGYDRNLDVFFSNGPVLETGIKAVTGGMDVQDVLGGAPGGKPSGRGTAKEPDVIQGRIQKVEKMTGAGTGIPPEYKDMIDHYMPSDLKKVRVVMRFDSAANLLVSGLLDGGEELAGKPAVIDVPVGRGHIVFFAVNPIWRNETFGSFALLFNAVLNYQSLDAGRPAAAPAAGEEPKK